MISAVDNNPLKFVPGAEEVMFQAKQAAIGGHERP